MYALEKAVLIALILHTAKFFKSGILKSDTASRKTRRRTQAIAKRYAFDANAKIFLSTTLSI